jgi:hypothetical protein
LWSNAQMSLQYLLYRHAIGVTKHCLKTDPLVGSCIGSLEVPIGSKAVAANPVFKSLMQMEQNNLHSGRLSTSTLQRVLGTLPTPLQASVEVMKKAVTLASGYTLQDHVDGYALVEPWLEILAEHNQKMHTIVGRMNADENLSHVVLVFPYVEAAVQFLLPMFCLDMAHMKTILIAGLENLQLGKLFVAGLTGRTAANQQLPIAIGLFRSESYEGGYKLLLESIPAEVMRYINRKEVMVSTDRGPAVLKSFESGNPLDQVTQLLCKTHLEKNLKHHGWNFHISHFERARDATTEVEYERKMLQLKEVNEPMHDYLKSIPHWQLWPLIALGCMAFGFRSDNMAEVLFGFILPERRLSVYYFLRAVMLKVWNSVAEHRLFAEGWRDILTPFARASFDDSLRKFKTSPFAVVHRSVDDNHFTVSMRKYAAARAVHFTVDFDVPNGQLPHCSCENWGQKGAPCEHGAVCLNLKGILTEPRILFSDKYFHRICFSRHWKEMYLTAFKPYRMPSDSDVLQRKMISRLPPLKPDFCEINSSRSMKRVASCGEKVGKSTISYAKFKVEKKPCRACGLVLAHTSFHKHYKSGACERWAALHLEGASEAAEYYRLRFGRNEIENDEHQLLTEIDYQELVKGVSFNGIA